MPAPAIALYGSEGLLWGQEPTADCGGNTGINCVPQAQNVQISTEHGTAVNVVLIGDDPDGVITAYNVVSGPSNGVLSGSGAERSEERRVGKERGDQSGPNQ